MVVCWQDLFKRFAKILTDHALSTEHNNSVEGLYIKYINMWVHWCMGTVVYGYIGIWVQWYVGTLVYGYSGMWVHWYMGTVVCGYIGIWYFDKFLFFYSGKVESSNY